MEESVGSDVRDAADKKRTHNPVISAGTRSLYCICGKFDVRSRRVFCLAFLLCVGRSCMP